MKDRFAHIHWPLVVFTVALLMMGCLFIGGSPSCAFGAQTASDDGTTSQIRTSTQESIESERDAVEVSAEGGTARIEGGDLALADFTRMEKGSNRAIDGTYRGYCYLMDAPKDSLCAIDMTSFVVVYIPQQLARENGLDLNDAQVQEQLKALIYALDGYSASGNTVIRKSASWVFTDEELFAYEGFVFGFSQEYRPGYLYTSIRAENGSDVTDPANPLFAQLPETRLSHVDYASIQQAESVAIAAAPSALEALGSFFATLDWSPLWVTLKTTGTALVFIFILGLLAAWWTMRLAPRAQSIFDAIFTIPMVLPPTVCGFLLLLCLGRNTPVGAWFDQIGFPLVFSWQATVIAAVVVAFPLMYRSARGAFESIDADMLDAARTLGWSEGRIFFRLMLPLAWSSIAAGTMLAFARALGEFGATLFLAGNYAGITRTIPIAIYFEWMGGNIEAALFWAIVVILISFVVIFAINIWSKRTTKYRRKGASA